MFSVRILKPKAMPEKRSTMSWFSRWNPCTFSKFIHDKWPKKQLNLKTIAWICNHPPTAISSFWFTKATQLSCQKSSDSNSKSKMVMSNLVPLVVLMKELLILSLELVVWTIIKCSRGTIWFYQLISIVALLTLITTLYRRFQKSKSTFVAVIWAPIATAVMGIIQ